MSGMVPHKSGHGQHIDHRIAKNIACCGVGRLMVSFFGACSFLALLALALLLVFLPLVLPPLPPPPAVLLLVPIGIMVLLLFIALVPSNIVVSSV